MAEKPKRSKIEWWNPNAALSHYNPATAMLLNHAMTVEKTVHVGTLQGSVDVDNREEFHKSLLTASNGVMVICSQPMVGRGPSEVMIAWADGSIVVKYLSNGRAAVEVSTTNRRLYSRLVKVCQRHLSRYRPSVHMLAQNSSGDITSTEVGGWEVEFEAENYEPHIGAQFDTICNEIISSSPNGRLTIIHGEPGSGKTHLIKGLVNDVCQSLIQGHGDVNAVRFMYVPTNLVQELGSPMLVQALLNSRDDLDDGDPLVLIVEDADQCLRSRDEAMAAVSSILNAADGLLGSSLNLHVICTTNVKVDDIDNAVTRAGRLSVLMEVTALSAEKSLEIFKRLIRNTKLPAGFTDGFNRPYTLAEIYRCAKVAVDQWGKPRT